MQQDGGAAGTGNFTQKYPGISSRLQGERGKDG